MPLKPKRPCAHPGCPNLAEAGERYCEKHKHLQVERRKQYDQKRGSSASRGYGYRWQKYRIRYLMENPLCVECQKKGKLIPARHVDHIKPVSGPDDPLFWEPSNHQGLCHSCHSKKTAKEDGGFGNKKG